MAGTATNPMVNATAVALVAAPRKKPTETLSTTPAKGCHRCVSTAAPAAGALAAAIAAASTPYITVLASAMASTDPKQAASHRSRRGATTSTTAAHRDRNGAAPASEPSASHAAA